jgi:pyruvate formate-lyase/glycerol dehydratase family glycyl radical enzyme
MGIVLGEKSVKEVGTWQEFFVPTCSERIQTAKKRAIRTPEVCLERARAEMKAYEICKNEPRIIQRARVSEAYLRDKTIYILDDELVVGNITSKIRGASFSGEMSRYMETELDDPVKDFEIRPYEKLLINSDERKEIREVLVPYFKGKTIGEYILSMADAEIKEKAFSMTASCPHIPVIADLSIDKDIGHQMANYEKVLLKGLKGIRDEVERYKAQASQPYQHFGTREKLDFYNAVLITLDAAIAYTKRYADLAREMASREANPKRRAELERIAENCERVPANPARDWWEALQSVWMTHVLIHCDVYNIANSFGRFDQYMYPFYKKTVLDEKAMSRNDALELLEAFWIKPTEWAVLLNYDVASYQPGQGLSQTLMVGGQTREGKDACNEVTMLCIETEEQVGLPQPELAMRVWKETPKKYLKKAAECIRIGRGKPKFIGDRKGIQMAAKALPERTIEDWREFSVMGCTELTLPHIVMQHSWEGVCIVAKILELVLNNGKCSLCSKQIGPPTGDPRAFESIAAVREAFREQVFYWMKHMARGISVVKKGQADRLMSPFCSSLMEGPLQKGIDITRGGVWYNSYGVYLAGLADTSDSLAVIDKLIYRDKKITWNELLDALKNNFKGLESLRQLCINGVPKYGNDDDFADDWACWVMDMWYDSVDWLNGQTALLPYYGGKYTGATIIGQNNVTFGPVVGTLPNGRVHPSPLADTISPSQGMDRKGPTAVIKSVGKLPTHRFAMGGPMNLRLSPQLMATDRDLDNFVSFLRTTEELGVYHIQFNVISSETLRKAMKEPEKYRDLLVRVASYCTYFNELTEEQKLDIIRRTEQQGW